MLCVIVGYQNYDVVAGYNVFTPIFENTDTENSKLDIVNLKLVGATDGDTLQILNEKGKFIATYYWFNAFENYPEGWCSDSLGFEPITSHQIEKGEGFYLYLKKNAKLQTSGSVKQGEFVKPLYAGYNMVGNATPYTVDLQNFKFVNATDGDTLQILNKKGKFIATYYWFNAFEDYPEGWCYDSLGFEVVPEGAKSLFPGEGVYIHVKKDCSYKINPKE